MITVLLIFLLAITFGLSLSIAGHIFAGFRKHLAIRKRFARLVKDWKANRGPHSDAELLFRHPAYQEIIGMGRQALPLIMAEQRRSVDHWFWALRAITNTNPVLPGHEGNLFLMADDWARWWRSNKNFTRNVVEEFFVLSTRWERATGHLSNVTTMSMKPDYQAIMGLGKPVVPLMLSNMQIHTSVNWNWALYFINEQEQIPFDPKDAGKVVKMCQAWINWGRAKGII